MTAAELLAATLDPGSWLSWDEPVSVDGLAEDYVTQLRTAAHKAGTDEAVITGYGLIRGRPVAMLVSEFRFLGGSIGQAAADRIVRAVRRATAERLPLIAATASGGTRMQEGTPAFLTMVDITRAIVAHKAAGPVRYRRGERVAGAAATGRRELHRERHDEPGARARQGAAGQVCGPACHGRRAPDRSRAAAGPHRSRRVLPGGGPRDSRGGRRTAGRREGLTHVR
jgi:acyl-CoA carboxylase subunit beta